MLIASVGCMSIKLPSQEEQSTTSSEEIDTNYIYWALLTGLIAPVLMSSKHVIIRKYKGNYDAFSQAVDSSVLEYGAFTFIFIFLVNSEDYQFTWSDFWIGTGAGILLQIARVFIAIAVSQGIASCA